jgi:hypothetical protein
MVWYSDWKKKRPHDGHIYDNKFCEKPRCGLCGKVGQLVRTPCCGNWICDDADKYVPFSFERNSCHRNHALYTNCASHHSMGHTGRWQECAQCLENGPVELFVYRATNEYNFEKLENLPAFEPTLCQRCGVRIRLAYDGYSMNGDSFLCTTCSETQHPGQGQALANFRSGLSSQQQAGDKHAVGFPMGTLAYYGPTSRLATKIAAAIISEPEAEPDPLHRWTTQAGDIRDDRAIATQVAAFFRRHRVQQIATSDRIMGCPHEEGKDYPLGGKCPHCPFWHDRDRWTLDLVPAGGMTAAAILAELSKPNPIRPPTEALIAAEHQRNDLIEPLLRALERGIGDPAGTPPGESMLFSYASYLLAKWREPRAYPLFIQWLSLPNDDAFDIGGDILNEDGSRFWQASARATWSP